MIFKTKNNLSIYYEDFGSGTQEPILFLHGWEGSVLSFSYFANILSKKTRCILIDFPPFGNSSSPTEPLTVKDYTNIVLQILEDLKINKVNIVAHSFGGRVAIELASHNKNLVKFMLLTSSAGLNKKSLIKSVKVFNYKFKKFLSKINLYPKKKLQKCGSEEYKKLSPVMQKTFINIVNYNQIKLLAKISCPVLLVWGTLDKETPFYFTKIFKKHIKDCEVISFKDCSHFAYLERPKLFLNIMQSFFLQ